MREAAHERGAEPRLELIEFGAVDDAGTSVTAPGTCAPWPVCACIPGVVVGPCAAMFGVDDAMIERHRDWLFPLWADEAKTWEMVVQSFVVEVDDRIVVVEDKNLFVLEICGHQSWPRIINVK